eukprot:gene42444-57461_t
MAATVKIIPLAVAGAAVEQAVQLLRKDQAIKLKPFQPRKVGLVATQLPGLKPSVMDKTRQVLAARLALSGSNVETEVRVAHRSDDVAEAISRLTADHQMIIVMTIDGNLIRLTDEQSRAILALTLSRLTGLGRDEIGNEARSLADSIQGYLTILASREKIMAIV